MATGIDWTKEQTFPPAPGQTHVWSWRITDGIGKWVAEPIPTLTRCPDCGEYGCPTNPCGTR